jgi:hypothetical protein
MKNCKHCGTEHNLRGKECRVCKDGMFRYKMTRNDMLQLHESQNKQCALCEKELAMFNGGSYNSGNIDHCHTSGKVRGILCHQCNTFIGYLEQKVPLDKIQFYLNGV